MILQTLPILESSIWRGRFLVHGAVINGRLVQRRSNVQSGTVSIGAHGHRLVGEDQPTLPA